MSSTIKSVLRKTCLILIIGFTFLTVSHAQAQQEIVDIRVDGDNGLAVPNPPDPGDTWSNSYKYLPDALDRAEFLTAGNPDLTVRLWVASTIPSNPYRPDRDANNEGGTGDRSATFLLDFNNIQVLGGFLGDETDPSDRDPALYETVLSGVLQPGCGVPEAGGCFVANGTPGCDNAACCEAVCTVDPDCCAVAWDQACADLAFNVCGSCGDPGSGDCFVANRTPGCDDATCCEIVCSVDPDCCNDQWDEFCVFRANNVCGVCGEPDSGSCFEPNDTPGCEDGNCCALVCDIDPGCCIFPWAQACADFADDVCSPPTPGNPAKAYHVVTADGVDDSVRIDGFTVTGGLANGSFLIDHLGAGMFIIDANLAVVRCIFTGNSAPPHGGGGMHIQDASHPLVVNCQFFDNDGAEGGAIHSEFGSAGATLVNCLFVGNIATGNQGDHGAAIDHGNSSGLIIVTNCTFTENTADVEGGAIFLHCGGQAVITNSVLWNNSPDEIAPSQSILATVTYSDVQGGWPCPDGMPNCGNIGDNLILDDPLFVDAANGDYRLMQTSPCIDVANNDDVPCDQFDLDNDGITCDEFDPENNEGTPDLDLINRILPGDPNGEAIVDMGSYEFRHPDVCSCPDICPADLDGSCDVGVKDLLFLLGAWGPNPGHPADFDDSGDVGVKDLLFLLGTWGPCPCGAGPIPPPLQEAVEDVGLTMADWEAFEAVVLSLAAELAEACLTEADWDEFVDVMTDPNASQADKDNYDCWMRHYLNHCTGMACTTPNCPGDAPFGHHE